MVTEVPDCHLEMVVFSGSLIMYSMFLQYIDQHTSYLLFLTLIVLIFLLVSKIRDIFGLVNRAIGLLPSFLEC